MIGHQRIGVKLNALTGERLAQPMQVALIILFAEKAGLAIVTTLHDVQRQAIKVNTRAAGRLAQSIANKSTPLILRVSTLPH